MLIQSNLRFNPYSYEEIVKPLEQLTEAHNQAEQNLAAIKMQSTGAETIFQSDPDSESAKTLAAYQTALTEAQNNLNTTGYNSNTAKTFWGLSEEYKRQVAPIEAALVSRAQRDAETNKLAQSGDVMVEFEPGDRSIDDYVKNPNLAPKTLDGKFVMDITASAFAPYAKILRDTRLRLVGGQYESMEFFGYTPQEVAAAMAGNGPEELVTVLRSVVAATGMDSWEGDQTRNIEKFTNFLNLGAQAAIGTDKSSFKNAGSSGSSGSSGNSGSLMLSEIVKTHETMDVNYRRARQNRDVQAELSKIREEIDSTLSPQEASAAFKEALLETNDWEQFSKLYGLKENMPIEEMMERIDVGMSAGVASNTYYTFNNLNSDTISRIIATIITSMNKGEKTSLVTKDSGNKTSSMRARDLSTIQEELPKKETVLSFNPNAEKSRAFSFVYNNNRYYLNPAALVHSDLFDKNLDDVLQLSADVRAEYAKPSPDMEKIALLNDAYHYALRNVVSTVQGFNSSTGTMTEAKRDEIKNSGTIVDYSDKLKALDDYNNTAAERDAAQQLSEERLLVTGTGSR